MNPLYQIKMNSTDGFTPAMALIKGLKTMPATVKQFPNLMGFLEKPGWYCADSIAKITTPELHALRDAANTYLMTNSRGPEGHPINGMRETLRYLLDTEALKRVLSNDE